MFNVSTLDKLNIPEEDARLQRSAVMERSPIHRTSVADQVASILRKKILEGDLRPGMPLQEVPLASSLGVSRNTMREAMRVLAIEGLLKKSPHRGVAVAQLSLKDVQEIYHVRRMLEIPSVLAAKKDERGILNEMRTAVEQYERAVGAKDWVKAVTVDLHFHSLLIRFQHNKRLESFYQQMIGELRMGMVLVDRRHDDPGGLIPVHRRMYQLLTAGKLKACSEILARHLDDSEARLTRVMNGWMAKSDGKLAT